MENSGAPPLPNRLEKAVMITMMGKQSPTAPSAVVPTMGFSLLSEMEFFAVPKNGISLNI